MKHKKELSMLFGGIGGLAAGYLMAQFSDPAITMYLQNPHLYNGVSIQNNYPPSPEVIQMYKSALSIGLPGAVAGLGALVARWFSDYIERDSSKRRPALTDNS